MSAVDHAALLGQHVRVLSLCDPTMVMGAGEIVAFCESPSITLRAPDGSLSHHSVELPREPIDPPSSCSQCGQRTPVCKECGDSIIFVPKSGFGSTGEWQHIEPPRNSVGHHQPRPKVFVS